MPNSETFSIKPIGEFVRKYLANSKVSIDPFARNKRWATYTNDLNPNTEAEYHMEAVDFLEKLKADGVLADLVLWDPPYSPRQVKECYQSFGHKMQQGDALLGAVRKKVREAIDGVVAIGGRVLCFGWNTVGMGKAWDKEEILLVCHGSDHNDTICMAERKLPSPSALL
jgi:hypothetical protein